MSASPPAWQWPRLRLRPALLTLGGMLLLGLYLGTNYWLAAKGDGSRERLLFPILRELISTTSTWVLLPVPMTAILNARRPWPRALGIHALAFLVFGTLDLALFLGIRQGIWSLAGWGSFLDQYGHFAWRLPMEAQRLLAVYVLAAGGFAVWRQTQAARERERREAELKARLQEAQLAALSAQLDPHFLFNALNTVSSVMYEDLARTDHLLASLGRMLRDGLEADGNWTLERELAHLEAFLDFARARFGDRLRITQAVEPGLGATVLPRFALQRLVENALKHNLDRAGEALSIALLGRREGETVVLEVSDDGTGFADPECALDGPGLGLRNLARALELACGEGSRLELGRGPAGGATARIILHG